MNLRNIIEMFGAVLYETRNDLLTNHKIILDYIHAALDEEMEANENTLAELRGELREQTSELYGRSRTIYHLENELNQTKSILENVQKANEIMHRNVDHILEPIMRAWFKANILRPANDNMKKIMAIKHACAMSGLSLKESKDWVEAFMPRLEQEHEDWLDEQSQVGGNMMMDGTDMAYPTMIENFATDEPVDDNPWSDSDN